MLVFKYLFSIAISLYDLVMILAHQNLVVGFFLEFLIKTFSGLIKFI